MENKTYVCINCDGLIKELGLTNCPSCGVDLSTHVPIDPSDPNIREVLEAQNVVINNLALKEIRAVKENIAGVKRLLVTVIVIFILFLVLYSCGVHNIRFS